MATLTQSDYFDTTWGLNGVWPEAMEELCTQFRTWQGEVVTVEWPAGKRVKRDGLVRQTGRIGAVTDAGFVLWWEVPSLDDRFYHNVRREFIAWKDLWVITGRTIVHGRLHIETLSGHQTVVVEDWIQTWLTATRARLPLILSKPSASDTAPERMGTDAQPPTGENRRGSRATHRTNRSVETAGNAVGGSVSLSR